MQLDDIRYNPELCGFEALARFRHNDLVFSYPVFLPAPVNAEFSLILRGLQRKGREMHHAPQKGMVMCRPAVREQRAMPDLARRLIGNLLGHHAS